MSDGELWPSAMEELTKHLLQTARKFQQLTNNVDIGAAIDQVSNAARIGAWLIAQEESPKRCPGCKHAPHAEYSCFHMEDATTKCSCTVKTLP